MHRTEPDNPTAVALRSYARQGDPDAFAMLVDRHRPMVLATCQRQLGSVADSEDAVQDTLLKLAQNADRVRSSARTR